ncbi:MAG: hypothetical protein WKF77_14735, partial [Planctomycetaceae bacterium]
MMDIELMSSAGLSGHKVPKSRWLFSCNDSTPQRTIKAGTVMPRAHWLLNVAAAFRRPGPAQITLEETPRCNRDFHEHQRASVAPTEASSVDCSLHQCAPPTRVRVHTKLPPPCRTDAGKMQTC